MAVAYRLVVLLALPARLAHELLHILPALPFATAIRLDIDPRRGNAVARFQWGDGVPHAVVALSALAPLAAGVCAAAVGVWALAEGGVPTNPTEMGLLAIGAAYIAMVGKPSPQDIRTARGGGDG
jgi:hypothetical protein